MTKDNKDLELENVSYGLPKKLYKTIDGIVEQTKTWKYFCGFLMVIILGLMVVLSQMPKHITIYRTTELKAGSTHNIDYVPSFNLYSFALYLFQQMYTAQDVSKDIQTNINNYSNFLTPEFKSNLLNRLQLDNSVIKQGVTRTIGEISGKNQESKVVQLTPNKWTVFLDLKVVDRLNGEIIKTAYIRYPVIVERTDYNENTNPAALVMSGFYQEPIRIK